MRNLAALIGLLLALLLTDAASAQDFQKGLEAADRGDFETALKEWRPLAQQGDALAQHNLGVMYRNGQGVPQDYTEAVKWYRLAVKQGYPLAQNDLGLMYKEGRGVPQDYTEAARLYRTAAEQGNASAQNNLGFLYAQGHGVPQDYTEALRWFTQAAKQEVANAQYTLGRLYANGLGARQDYSDAAKWYRSAAEQGHAKAQNELGLMHARGQGVPQDYTEALRWFRLSAAQKYAIGQNNLGLMYRNGHGVRQDYATAVMLYRLSAAQGYALAQGSLGVMYQHGDGVRRDYEEAYMWYTLAAEQGHESANQARLSLEQLMSAEQKTAAFARVQERKEREKMARVPKQSSPADGAPAQEVATGALPEKTSAPLSASLGSPTEAVAKAPAPPLAKSAVEKPPALAGGAPWRIQLASLIEQTDAEAEWKRLQRANQDLLDGLTLHVQQAKLSKGIFYRVQAGPLADRAIATSLCNSLKSRNQDCLIVVP